MPRYLASNEDMNKYKSSISQLCLKMKKITANSLSTSGIRRFDSKTSIFAVTPSMFAPSIYAQSPFIFSSDPFYLCSEPLHICFDPLHIWAPPVFWR